MYGCIGCCQERILVAIDKETDCMWQQDAIGLFNQVQKIHSFHVKKNIKNNSKVWFLKFQPFGEKLANETDPNKLAMYKRMKTKIEDAVKHMETVVNKSSGESVVTDARQVFGNLMNQLGTYFQVIYCRYTIVWSSGAH